MRRSKADQDSHLGPEFPLSELIPRFKSEWAARRHDNDGPVTRLTSFNLLVVSTGTNEKQVEAVLKGLLKSHPARVIWTKILPERNWEDSTARLHLGCRCADSKDSLQVCSEQIQICCGDDPERLASLILSLIHGGLATHLLWWKSGSTGNPLFRRLSDRCQTVLVEPESWLDFARDLPELWEDRNLLEHAFYPLIWHQLTHARQMVASAYNEGNIELALPKQTNARRPDSDLLKTWLEVQIPQLGLESSGARVVATAEYPTPTVKWNGKSEQLELQTPLEAIRIALDRPGRERVFEKIVKKLGEKDL